MLTGPPMCVTPEIRSIVEELGLEGEPEMIDVFPSTDRIGPDWFAVLERHVTRRGGQIVYGWRFWEWPWAFIEAEFHPAWRDEEGVLRDVVPNTGWIGTQSMFIPDPTRVYEGHQLKPIRRALRDDPTIEEFFQAIDAEFTFMNRDAGEEQRDRLLAAEGMMQAQALRLRKTRALDAMMARIPDPGRNDPCPCGSGKKYKRCHGA